MPWYLYLAIKQLFPAGKRVSFFFWISVLGVALGVWILVVVQSVMGGFGQIYREKIVETIGHIRIESGTVMYDYRKILDYLDKQPSVEGAAPYGNGIVMLQHKNRPAFPGIRGIDIEREKKVIPLEKFMWLGSVDDLDDDSVLLSKGLAASVGATLGSTVEVYTPLMLELLDEDEVLLPRELRVVGIYETGWNDVDKNSMTCTLRLMQELYNMQRGENGKKGVHGITVKLKPGYDEEKVAEEFEKDLFPPNRVLTWLDIWEDYLWVLQLEKNMMFLLLIPIVLVAAFAISNAQLLTVIRKTREIGLIGAMGGRPSHLAAAFCFQGFIIGLVGTALGFLTAWVFLFYRNDIIHGFAKLMGTDEVLVKYYQFANLPVHYTAMDLTIISLSALFLTTLGGLIPALRAAKMKPADALRSE